MKSLAVLVILLASSGTAAAQSRVMTVTVDGTERRLLLFAPKSVTAPAPVVFAFHGAGDTADNFAGIGLHSAWPGAVVVYMEGLGRRPGSGGSFQTTDAGAGNRDLKFFDSALTAVRRELNVDSSRVFATGFSNGAKFVYLLWATRAETFAGFAPVAGMLTAPVALSEPRPFIHIAGREDRQNDFAEQQKSIELGLAVNGSARQGSCGRDCLSYTSSKGAASMTVIHADGHIWPADATSRIVRFFQALP